MKNKVPGLHSNEVHVWKCKISGWRRGYLALLSDRERDQALRYSSNENRNRYAMAHAFLRTLLEHYLGTPATQIEIIQDNNKKPRLKSESQPPIYFNLSYRGEYSLVAISGTSFIGVDVESIKEVEHISSFMSSYFSHEEKQKVLAIKNSQDRLAMLFTLWVMKEALVKALSTGISESSIHYNICPFLQQSECIPDFDSSNTWHIERINIGDYYKAACAIRASNTQFKFFEYVLD